MKIILREKEDQIFHHHARIFTNWKSFCLQSMHIYSSFPDWLFFFVGIVSPIKKLLFVYMLVLINLRCKLFVCLVVSKHSWWPGSSETKTIGHRLLKKHYALLIDSVLRTEFAALNMVGKTPRSFIISYQWNGDNDKLIQFVSRGIEPLYFEFKPSWWVISLW